MYNHQYSVLGSAFCFLIIVGVIGFILYKFFTGNTWKYLNTPKQKNWKPNFLLNGESLRVVCDPYCFPDGKQVVIKKTDYKDKIISAKKDVIIYWKKSDYCEAKRLYEDQIMAKS